MEPVAIIGLACRLPGARDAAEFWRNLADGVESIRLTTLEEQAALGVPASTWQDPNFVPAAAVLDDYEYIDAAFFGMSSREAELRDPQHRLFLELAYTALADAGYDAGRYAGEIGVYGGTGEDAYQWRYTRRNAKVLAASGAVAVAVSSHPDYLSTFTSYKLNLTGPSLTLHTACSTSLVALHVACEALRGGECDMALSGAANIDMPVGWGYTYLEGGILSPDGHCRPFDARAEGTVWGSGGGVVVLKRLSDALADGDHIRALVLGNAVNNDGASKVGFTAPSEQGQAAAIAQALAVADVDARTISYVEAHGTGTALGDPIEVAALCSAYRPYSADTGWCAIGSVKSNLGHLGPAAGIAGVIKTVLSLEHELIPANLHYESPNPKIDFDRSPFYVNTNLSAWQTGGAPRRAGLSSFGMGGTNGHVILQEAPASPPRPQSGSDGQDRPVHLVRLSARTQTALEKSAQQLAAHLNQAPAGNGSLPHLCDVAYTLRVGRRELPQRLAVVASDPADAAAALADPGRRIVAAAPKVPPRLALLFSGQGAQYAGMGARLYRAEPVFRDAVDECVDTCGDQFASTLAGLGSPVTDLRDIIFARGSMANGTSEHEAPDGRATAEEILGQTAITQPALFVLEYALARLWLSWGAQPAAMVGHSIGEYVAATLAGVFAVPDALRLVAERGRLMQGMPPGAMLAVQLSEDEIRSRLQDGLSVAVVNGPQACVVAGPATLVADFGRQLSDDRVTVRQLRTSHAFHSAMMEPVLAAFRAAVASVPRQSPSLPFLSNVTGQWITPDEATDPGYWARHARDTVRFGDCLATLLNTEGWMLVECGPGRQLCGFAKLQRGGQAPALPSLPGKGERKADCDVLYASAARAWTAGIDVSTGAPGHRIPLPTYPWERSYHYIKPDSASGDLAGLDADPGLDDAPLPVERWFAIPVWRQLPPAAGTQVPGRLLLFTEHPTGPLATGLRTAGADVLTVSPGERFGWDDRAGYTVRPADRADYDSLISHVSAAGGMPDRIVHAWGLTSPAAQDAHQVLRAQDCSFFSLLSLSQALAATEADSPVYLDVLTAGTADVTGPDLTRPEHATVAGIANVLPLEMPWLHVRHIDAEPESSPAAADQAIRTDADALLAELLADPGPPMIALRGGRRWQREFSEVLLPEEAAGLPAGPGLRKHGVYVITGGLGGIGITLATDLARRLAARLVLVARSALPPRPEWDDYLAAHGTAERSGRAIAAIRAIESAGAEVLVVTADVADPQDARRVRDMAMEQFGVVNGIVHAAGVPGGGMAEVKDRASADAVLRPKLGGTLALRDAFASDELDFVMLCSSVTAVAGGFGQADYCAANSFLDAYARGAHGWRAPVFSVNWGSWREVGMAAEVAAPAAFRALQRGERVSPMSHPVLTGWHAGDRDEPSWCRGVISPGTHWLLADHRISGIPVVPGTGHLEIVRAGLAAVTTPPSARHVPELRDVVFTEPLAVPDGTSAEVRVIFTTGAEGLDFEVVSLSGGATRAHARGSALWVDPPPPAQVDLAALRDRCALAELAGSEISISASGMLTFGPHWGNLSRVYRGQGEELALLEASGPVTADAGEWLLHPALLDEATAFPAVPDGRYLPLGYGRITIRGPLPARLWSHARNRETGSTEVNVADLSLFDDDGHEVVSITDFTLKKVRESPLSAALAMPEEGAAAVPAVLAASAVASGQVGTVAEPVAGHAVTGGIGPADGAEAFRRLAAVNLGPQVVISAMPIAQVMASVRQITQETVQEALAEPAAAPASQRQTGDGYVAPRNDTEAAIARLWGGVLGVEHVGVTDDFFDIGGNSLVAIQLIAMVRKEMGVRLPMRSLFEYPTVAGTAGLVAELTGKQEPAAGGPAQGEQPAGPIGDAADAADPSAATTIRRLPRQEPS